MDYRREIDGLRALALLSVLLIGDSYSQDLYNALTEVGFVNKLDIIVRFVPVACGVLFLDKNEILRLAEPKDIEFCKDEISLLDDEVLIDMLQSADQIWLASSWALKHAESMNRSLKNLRSKTHAKVLLFGRKNFPKLNAKHVELSKTERIALVDNMSKKLDVQIKMLDRINDDGYIDIQGLVCDSNQVSYESCRLFDKNGMPKSYDGGHLTKYGALHYGLRIKDRLQCFVFNDCKKVK